jgi:hypothetical protein
LLLPDSITVVRQTLTLFVLVRIQVRQQKPKLFTAKGFGLIFAYNLSDSFRKVKNQVEKLTSKVNTMDKLPHECKCSKIKVHPEDWDQLGASFKEVWYIQYRFYDPIFKTSFPKGKLCIYRKGINKAKTVMEKRLLIRKALHELTTRLKQGYNLITKITISPPGEEITLPYSTLPYLPIHTNSEIQSISINIDQGHLKVAKLLAEEIKKKELTPLAENPSEITITLLFPNTAFISTLWCAYRKTQGVRGYLTDVRSAIGNITIAAYFLDFFKNTYMEYSSKAY